MKNISLFYTKFLFLFFFILFPLHAQKKTGTLEMLYWANGGLGWSAIGSEAFNTSVILQSENVIYTFQITGHSYRDSWLFSHNWKEFYDYSALIGIANRNDTYHTSISAGLAYLTGYRATSTGGFFKKKVTTKKYIIPTLGVEISSQLFWKVGKVFGIGLNVFADLNAEEVLSGATISVFLGKLY